ncbi:hypothetical protein AAFF_G00153530 [Aldrovandia affinis]|uniref:C2 domain-containing protein n=1 Tax=Aldrovandia affinis TaxID=143900 RepID=A0AAD7SZX4_9TELE|nr:hypothetical protein AAFF_G00153530 [Aldrovandia affinis]
MALQPPSQGAGMTLLSPDKTFTPEAIGFLSAVGVFVVVLAVLFLFINKKLCFSRVGGLPCLEQYGRKKRSRDKAGIHQGLVNSFGDKEDQSSSSDSEEEIIKQFEISVSRSQSFRSGAAESVQQVPTGRRHKFTRLLSDQEEGSTEPSDCEDADGLSRLSYQDPLTHREDERGSLGSQDTADGPEPNPRRASAGTEGSMAPSLSRQATEGSPEMETAVDNQGYDNNEATDSSSTWSPEEQATGEALSQPPSSHRPISKCGDLIVILDYKAEAQKLLVTVVTARDIPDKDRSGMDTWQVHVVLLPGKKQRHKTSVQRGSAPRFSETFRFSRLDPAELGSSALRFRLYAVGKMSRERMMGERLFHLSALSLEGEMEATLVLEPRSDMKVSPLSS